MALTTPKSPPISADTRALAIETSGQSGSVALLHHFKVLVEQTFPHGLKNAAGLLPLIDRLLRQHRWSPAEIDLLLVSQGPGSFTGLRIGVTLAKTLSLATGAPIVPVPTLHVLASNAPKDAAHVIVVLDAKRDQIFTARYERFSEQWIEREPAHLDTLTGMMHRSPRPVHLLGEGLPFHEKFLPVDRAGIVIAPQDCWRARASVVAELGTELAKSGTFINADQFTPAYVRKPEAEEKYEHINCKPR